MISFAIDTTSKTAVYKQLISAVSDAVKDGRLKTGELVPSMNALSGELGISKETVKRAYYLLRSNGILEAQQGKGFYVADTSAKSAISVLFLIDRFSVYKQEIVHGFHQKMSFISKWLYIFALKNRNGRNLPLLLHLISAPFCSVSQSRVPTLMQR